MNKQPFNWKDLSQEIENHSLEKKDIIRFKYINNRFNEELEQQIVGTLPKGHVYRLGRPSDFLRRAGIPDLPIEMPASQLAYKSTSGKHDYDLSEVMNLPEAIANPIATFSYGDKGKSQNIVTILEHNGENFLVGMFIRPTVKGKVLEVNSIRNVFPKNTDSIIKWILDGKLTNTNKEKLLNFLDQQRTDYADVASVLPDEQVKQGNSEVSAATNIIENFENPTLPEGEILSEPDKYTPEEQNIIDAAKKEGTYMKAPNGKPSNLNEKQWVQVRTKAFKGWFGDWENDPQNASKVVDENGEPLVVYHGTTNDKVTQKWNDKAKSYDTSHEPFTIFSRTNDGARNAGHFFNSDQQNAYDYGYNTYDVFLNLQNPLVIEANGSHYTDIEYNGKNKDTYEWAEYSENKGHDGVIFKNVRDGVDYGAMATPTTDYVSFKANQIKSAIDNTGEFSRENDDIRFRDVGDLLKWADKTKLKNWLTQQRSNSADVAMLVSELDVATNIIQSFKNPTILEGEILAGIDQLSEELRIPVKKVQSRKDLPDGIQRQMKNGRYPGLFDPKAGEVYMVMNEITDIADAQATMLHEIVGHKGVRGLFGNKIGEFTQRVLDSMPENERETWVKKYNGNEQLAAEEYVARFAEGYENPGVWEKIKAIFRELFRDLGIDLKLSDNDMKYILWKAKNNLKQKNNVQKTVRPLFQKQNTKKELTTGSTLQI